MADNIFVRPDDLSSRDLKKTVNKAENALKKAMAAFDEGNERHSWAWGGNTYYLFNSNATDLLGSAEGKLREAKNKLDKLAKILDSGPDAMKEIDRRYKSEMKEWRKKGDHSRVIWTSGCGRTSDAVPINRTPDVIVNESSDFQHQWRGDYITPPKINKQGHRSPEAYREIMESLDVENNIRYKNEFNPYWGFSSTCCNVYVWDTLTAMDCPIPSTDYFGCGQMRDWMASAEGKAAGWVEIDEATAIEMANQGYPTVAADTRGEHVAMVAPQRGKDSGIYLSQAGAYNFNYKSKEWGWDDSYTVRYFYHQ